MRMILVVVALAGCGGQSSDGACTSSTQCDLAVGGLCTTAPSQKQYCAYPDASCPGIGGYRWSTYAGDGLASQCFSVPVVTVTLQGAGSGTVTSEPSGISCPGTCSAAFPTGSSVKLRATANSGDGFLGWGGLTGPCGFDGVCSIQVANDATVEARFEPGGYVAWAVKAEAATYAYIFKVVRFPDGDIAVAGHYSGQGKLGMKDLPAPGGIFVGKIASGDGSARWARRLEAGFQGLTADPESGDIIVTGHFFGTLDVGGPQPLISDGDGDMFVARFRGSDGAHVWSFLVGGSSDEPKIHVAVDRDRVIVAGSYNGLIDFGGGVMSTATGNCDIYIAWYSLADGILLTSPQPKTYGNVGACTGMLDAAVDGNGALVGNGYFFGSTTFGGGPSAPTFSDRGGLDIFVVKYDSSGNLSWVVTGGGAATSGIDQANSVTVGPGNMVYVTGWLDFVTADDPMDFNGVKLVGNGGVGNEIFAIAISPDGDVSWARRFGGASDDSGGSVAFRTDGTVVVAGTFASNFAFDGRPVSVDGPSDAFLCALNSANGGAVLSADRYGGQSSDSANGAVVDPGTNHVFMVGGFDSISLLGDKVLTATGSSAAFVARVVPGVP